MAAAVAAAAAEAPPFPSPDCSAAERRSPAKNLPSVPGRFFSTFSAARASAGRESSTPVYWETKSAAAEAGEAEAAAEESLAASAASARVRLPASPLPRSRTRRGLPLVLRSSASCEATAEASLAWPRRPASTTSW